jgi:hypothetical protein
MAACEKRPPELKEVSAKVQLNGVLLGAKPTTFFN